MKENKKLLIGGFLITATIILAFSLIPGKATALDSGYLLKELVKPNPVFQAYGIALDANDTIYLAGTEITIADGNSGQVLDRLTAEEIDVTTADDIVFGPNGSMYWTDLVTGRVGRVKPDGTVSHQFIGVGVNPIAFSNDGRLFVGRDLFGTGLYELDPELVDPPREIAAEGTIPGLNCFAVGPDSEYIYAPNLHTGEQYKIDVEFGEIVWRTSEFGGCAKADSQGQIHVIDYVNATHYKFTDLEAMTFEIVDIYPEVMPGMSNFAFDSQDNIYVSDHANGRVSLIKKNGQIKEFIKGGLIEPNGVAVLPGENNDDTIFVGSFLSMFQYDAQSGTEEYLHHWPPAITVSAAGENLVASSWFYNTVFVFNPMTHEILEQYWDYAVPLNAIMFQEQLVVAEVFNGVVMGNALADRVVIWPTLYPTGIAATETDLYAADYFSGKVVQIADDGVILAEPVIVADGLANPEGLAIDIDGTLLVVEATAGRLSRIDPATGEVTTVASGLAVTYESRPDMLLLPHNSFAGVAVGPRGDIYVAGAFAGPLYHLKPIEIE
jgi:DNA-binding beta-propeller fold protein YncE